MINVFNDLMATFHEDIRALQEKQIPIPDFTLSHLEKLGLLRAFHLMCLAKTRQKITTLSLPPQEITYLNSGLLALYQGDRSLVMENGPGLCEGIKDSTNPDMFWSHTLTSMLDPGRFNNTEIRMGMAGYFGIYLEHATTLVELCTERAWQEKASIVEDAVTRYVLDTKT